MRHAALAGGVGHRGGNFLDNPRIKGVRDDIFRREFFRGNDSGNGVCGCQLHGFIDVSGSHIQRAAENPRESQHVVYLVGEVGAPGTHDPHSPCQRFVGQDFRRRIGHGKDDGVRRHSCHHVAVNDVAGGDADEDVGSDQGCGEVPPDGCSVGHLSHFFLGGVIGGVARDKYAGSVTEKHIVDTRTEQELGHGYPCRACAIYHHFHIAHVLAEELQGIDQPGQHNDCGSVLVIVKDRDVHQLLQLPLDFEASRSCDILKIDPAKARCQQLDRTHDFCRVFGIQADRHSIYVGEGLEEQSLAFHYRQSGGGTDVAQAKHGRTVSDHSHQVALDGVTIDICGIAVYLLAGLSHPGGVGHRQLLPIGDGYLAYNLQFSFVDLV